MFPLKTAWRLLYFYKFRASAHSISELDVYGDSALIINQVSNKWKTVDSGLQKYHAYMEELIAQFKDISFHYLPRDRNRYADALATLASLVEIPDWKAVKPLRIGRRETPAYCCEIEKEKETIDEPWYNQIYQYLQNGEASFTNEDGKYKEGIKAKNMMALKRLASHTTTNMPFPGTLKMPKMLKKVPEKLFPALFPALLKVPEKVVSVILSGTFKVPENSRHQ